MGVSVERELRSGATGELPPLPAGSYLRLAIGPSDVDLDGTLFAPEGGLAAASDGAGTRRERRVLSLVTLAAGRYRLTLAPHGSRVPAGRYTIALEEFRPALPADANRVAAERAMAEAQRLRARQEASARRDELAKLEEASRLWDAAGDCRGKIAALNQIGALQAQLSRFKLAFDAAQEALSLATRLGDLAEQADALTILGGVNMPLGDRQQRLDSLTQALALHESLGDRGKAARTLYHLGEFYYDQANLERALDYYRRAAAIQSRIEDLAGMAWSLAAIGSIYTNQGASQALQALDSAIEASRAAGDRAAEEYTLRQLALLHMNIGRLQDSLAEYRQALEMSKALGDQIEEGKVDLGLGTAYLHVGESDKALERYRRAAEIFHALGVAEESNALFYIGWYGMEGNPRQALDLYTRALHLNEGSPYRPLILHGMGKAYLELGALDDAIRTLSAAQQSSAAMKDAIHEAQSVIELGKAHLAAGDREQAAKDFNRASELADERSSPIVRAAAMAALARLERERGNLTIAIHEVEEALDIVERVRTNVVGPSQRMTFLATRREYYELHVDLLMRMHERNPAAGHQAAALAASERARARGLLDLLAEGRIDVRKGVALDLKQRETEINARISRLQQQLMSGRGGPASRSAERYEELRAAQEEQERLELEIRTRHPGYAEVAYPRPRRTEDIQRLLDEQTALLEYFTGPKGSVLFVVVHDGLTSYRLPPAEQLRQLSGTVQAAVRKPGTRLRASYVRAARQLYELLIAPAGRVLAGKTRLIISPDGPLLSLSFEVLLTSEQVAADDQPFAGLSYLILDKSISYVASASVLAELAEPRPDRRTTAGSGALFVGFGDPAYRLSGGLKALGDPQRLPAVPGAGRAAGGREPSQDAHQADLLLALPRLAESRREITEIASLYRPAEVRLYLGAEAKKSNVQGNDALAGARRVHFAAHGFVSASQPELSGLVLAQEADSGENGLLQVFEIFNLELSAEVVVLSACDSGLGKEVQGEGLIGMTRALLYAGAASVVVSLWPVEDRSTSELMVAFYREMDRSGDRSESLRQAKLGLLRQGGEFSHPFYWAPFVLIGRAK